MGAPLDARSADDVEAIATRFGFTVVYPEDHPLAEQVKMFPQAEVVAGYAGSGLFTLASCLEPTRLILLASQNYTAGNEYLIAWVRGHPLDLLCVRPSVRSSTVSGRTPPSNPTVGLTSRETATISRAFRNRIV